MALIDYKFHRTKQVSNNKTEVVMAIYDGAITTEDEYDLSGNLQPVTRYRRNSKLEEITRIVSGKIPAQAAVRRCNKILKDYADENGHTVITEQSDV